MSDNTTSQETPVTAKEELWRPSERHVAMM